MGGANRWKYDSFVNWEFFPSVDLPILVYFKETQTPQDQWDVGPGQWANGADALAKGAVKGQVPRRLVLGLGLALGLARSRGRCTQIRVRVRGLGLARSRGRCHADRQTAGQPFSWVALGTPTAQTVCEHTPTCPSPNATRALGQAARAKPPPRQRPSTQVHFFPCITDAQKLKAQFEAKGCAKL